MIHMDDIILRGDHEFMENILLVIKSRFRISKNQLSYIGMALRTDEHNDMFMNQNQYIEEMVQIPEGAEDTLDEQNMKELIKKTLGKLLY